MAVMAFRAAGVMEERIERPHPQKPTDDPRVWDEIGDTLPFEFLRLGKGLEEELLEEVDLDGLHLTPDISHVYRSSNPFFDNENWLMGKRADLLSFAEELFEFGNLRMKAPFAFDPGVHLRVVKADAGEKLLREAVGVAEEIDAVPNRTGQSGDALLFDVFFR